MICANCKNEFSEQANFCPFCGEPRIPVGPADGDHGTTVNGLPLDTGWETVSYEKDDRQTYKDSADSGSISWEEPQNMPYIDEPKRTQSSSDDSNVMGIASIVFGVLGLLMAGLIFGIVSLVLARTSKKRLGKNTIATIGKIFGILSMLKFIVIICVVIIFVALGMQTYNDYETILETVSVTQMML